MATGHDLTLDDASQALLGRFRTAMGGMDEAGRARLAAALLRSVAEQTETLADGRQDVQRQSREMAQKLAASESERATLADRLATTQADLEHARRQLEAETGRAAEHQRLIQEQRERLGGLQRQVSELETRLTAREREVHELQRENEQLLLQAQRSQAASAGAGGAERAALEERIAALTTENKKLAAEFEQLRTDKNAEIDRLNDALRAAQGASGGGTEALLANWWHTLGAARPPVALPLGAPQEKAGDHLVAAFIELAHFAYEFEQGMRVFLDRYTRHNPSVKVPWEVYAKREDVLKIVQQTVAAQGGKPVGPLRMKLRLLRSWTAAAMIGNDVAVESIASELHDHLMGELGAGSDPNRKIKDYLRSDGHHLFQQHIREVRATKLAETYGRGG
ncbi:MAG: hypothetical protein C4547_13930 [Phycisphaerales bacterium]|nr:MAG: hypothetical protein C4547_13930 [Phycisphaerales bacterium]